MTHKKQKLLQVGVPVVASKDAADEWQSLAVIVAKSGHFLCAGRHLLTSTLAVEESVFETLRIKRYGRLVVLLTPAMKIISYDFNMLGYDYSIPQPVILNELGALMHQFQQFQQDMAQANSQDGPKPHEVMQIALTAVSNLGNGFEAEVFSAYHQAYPQRLGLSIPALLV